MKKIFLLTFLLIIFLFRFSTSVRVTNIFPQEIYKMKISLHSGKGKILKINNKYPLKNYYARLSLKENGEYQGYFLVSTEKEYKNSYFLNLEDINSEKIENNLFQKYLQKVFNRLEKNQINKIKNLNRAILLGDNSHIDKKLQEKIRYIGLSHLFAMSGLHIGLVLGIFYYIFKKILKNKRLVEISLLVAISFYYFGVKESPSFTRAYIMIFIYILGKLFYEKVNIGKSLLISAFISAIINPTVIFSISFQLSYLAVVAIIYVFPYVRKLNFRRYKILDYFLFTSTIQFFLAPLTVYYFETFPFLSIISNLVILPIGTFYISINYLALFLENFYLSFIFYFPIKLIYHLLIFLINFFAKFDYLSLKFYNDKILYIYLILFLIWGIYENYKTRAKNRI